MKICNGQVNFLTEHVLRLKKGMEVLKLEATFLNSDFIQDKIKLLRLKNNVENSGRARLTVYRSDGGFYTPTGADVSFTLELEPQEIAGYPLNEKGLQIGIYEEIKKPLNLLSNLKTGNALIFVLAGVYKTEQGWDDCLILNENGNICESTSFNVFIYKNNGLITPALSEGCIAGVMRGQVINIAKRNGINVSETTVAIDDLCNADEVFLTNASTGICWVSGLGENKYARKISEVLSDQLSEGCSGKLANTA